MSYEVVVTREGDNWLADVPELEGAHTYARSLAGLREAVREVIILAADLPDDAKPAVTWRYDVGDERVAFAAEVGRLRAELARREAAVQADTAKAIDELRRAGYSVRDSAALLNMTPGRVSQVHPDPDRPAPSKVRVVGTYTPTGTAKQRKAPARIAPARKAAAKHGK